VYSFQASPIDEITAMLHIISVNENVNQKVFLPVGTSLTIFLIMKLELNKKIIQRNGIKNHPKYAMKYP
jgi:hypothetical protein